MNKKFVFSKLLRIETEYKSAIRNDDTELLIKLAKSDIPFLIRILQYLVGGGRLEDNSK